MTDVALMEMLFGKGIELHFFHVHPVVPHGSTGIMFKKDFEVPTDSLLQEVKTPSVPPCLKKHPYETLFCHRSAVGKHPIISGQFLLGTMSLSLPMPIKASALSRMPIVVVLKWFVIFSLCGLMSGGWSSKTPQKPSNSINPLEKLKLKWERRRNKKFRCLDIFPLILGGGHLKTRKTKNSGTSTLFDLMGVSSSKSFRTVCRFGWWDLHDNIDCKEDVSSHRYKGRKMRLHFNETFPPSDSYDDIPSCLD